MVGKIEDKGRRGRQRMGWLESTTTTVGMNLSTLWERATDGEAWHAAVHGVTESQTLLGG